MRPPVLLVLAGLTSCGHRAPPADAPAEASTEAPPTPEKPPRFDANPTADGLGFTLSSVEPEGGSAVATPSAPATPLSADDTAKLLARAPALEAPASDRLPFAVRERSLPPPRAGATELTGFPSAAEAHPAPAAETGPLTVVRRSPEGHVPVAADLSVTFSRPMIAVSTQAEASAHVPVQLTPQVPGTWRWLGTKTLRFQPEGRLPAATVFTVTVPEGTRSVDGQTMAATSWTFDTPAPSLVRATRGQIAGSTLRGATPRGGEYGPQPLQPVFGLVFDQRVDPAAMLPFLKLSHDLPLRLATEAEVAADPLMKDIVEDPDLAGRYVAVVPVSSLPQDDGISLVIADGAPSAEGTRVTTQNQRIQFHTYGPLRVKDTRCDWGATPCPPTSSWTILLSNPLPPEEAEKVTIEPAVPGFEITAYNQVIRVSGAFVGRSTYTVTLPASLRDVFGQTLGKDQQIPLAIGPAERTLVGPDQPFVVADPAGGGTVSFFTTNSKGLKVRVNAVTAEDWPAWVEWNNRYRWEDARKGALPGRTVKSGTVAVKGTPDAMTETRLDLAPYLTDGHGMFLVQVEPVEPPPDRWSRQEWIGWVQVTGLGVSAFADRGSVTVWANDLATGRAAKGAQVSLLGTKASASTDADGLARIALQETQGLVVKRGTDTALLVSDPYAYGGGWFPGDLSDQGAWYVIDDKHLYKPGETVHVHGWLRRRTQGPTGDIAAVKAENVQVKWTLTSSMGNPLGEGTATLSKLGGFSLEVALPKTPDLGQASLTLEALGADVSDAWYVHTLDIEEYRTPEFEVSTDAGDGPWALGGDATVDVDAHYYAGGGLPNADVTWTAVATPASYAPPGREEWSFGAWHPWWWWGGEVGGATTRKSLTAKTDASGKHHLGMHFDTMKPARPYAVHVEATVMDVNRQAWTSGQDLLVHPSDVYLGLKTRRPWAEKGEPLTVDTLVVDRAGKVVPGTQVSLTMARLSGKHTSKGWEEVEVDPVTCAHASTADPGHCSFTPNAGGAYVVRGRVADRYGRPNETELRLWVSGADAAPDRNVDQERVTLLPEKQSYAPGETATFAVQAPFWPAEGTLTLRRDGLVEAKAIHVDGPVTTLSVPITEAYLPDLTVQVDLAGQQKRRNDKGEEDPALAPRVAYASGSLTFGVSTASRALTVAVTPAAKELNPGGSTAIDLAVTDAAGKPVADAELAVIAVDEAVLALSGYTLPDPLEVFYAARGAGVSDTHLRQWVALTDPTKAREGATGLGGLGMKGNGPGGGGLSRAMAGAPMMDAAPMPTAAAAPMAEQPEEKAASRAPSRMAVDATKYKESGGESPTTPIAMRSDFRALALWAPDVRTDAAGHATVPLKLPDSLTRYRVMVVAVAGEQKFGSGQADVTARLPLMVRPSLPRFLNFGDSLDLPVVVQNQTDAPMTVDVAVRAANLTVPAAGQRVTVPAKDRVELRFPATAEDAGTARTQFVVASGTYADASTVSLPVWTPATSEAFATYGVVDAGAVRQPITTPKDVWPQFGGLTVTTSSTNLQALTDAFLYLVHYPYDCNEQRAARLLGVAALRDVLAAFDAPGLPSKSELDASVAGDLEDLHRRQNGDGGWSFWRKNDPSWPYVSLEAAHAVVRIEAKGWLVDPDMKRTALQYARTIERHLPEWYSKEAKWVLRAYALEVLDAAGTPDVGKAKALVKEATLDRLPIEAQGMILPTLKGTAEGKQILAFLANRVAESAAGAHFVTRIDDGAHVLLESDRRADGVLLDALIQVEPKSDLIPKLVEGLLAHRRKGAWENTTENASVLLAMDRYFHTYEDVTPDFVARAWLGDTYAGEHTFKGHTTERARTDVPMDWLLDQQNPDLVLQKDGVGRMYYRIGLDYAPKNLHLDPADYGFAVTREYAAVDDPADVRRDADGTWHIKAGARVRVRLAMVNPMRRYHVALVDPLPAGFEVINPGLATSGAIPADENPSSAGAEKGWWWWRTWYEHENLRDDRVEAFASLLWEGVHDYTYVVRATTPGTFVVPPTKAEEMYTPETFGRAGSDRVVIE